MMLLYKTQADNAGLLFTKKTSDQNTCAEFDDFFCWTQPGNSKKEHA
jgi:hypothetical protein